MIIRRKFIATSMGVGAGLGSLSACAPGAGAGTYEHAVRDTWRHGTGAAAGGPTLQRELIRYATLAASSHNTQCWKFRSEAGVTSILPDFTRRCPVVDPDDHHLFVSLGCAAENLIQAAQANGLTSQCTFDAAHGGALHVALAPAKPVTSELFQAIPERQCTRGEYDGKPVSNHDLKLLEGAGRGNGVQVIFLTERALMEKALEHVVQANTAQMNDPAFVRELKAWIRFSGDEALRTRDGLYAASSGNPSLPRWMGAPLFGLFFTPNAENDKYAKQVRSSAGIAVFVSDMDDKSHWTEIGRCYQRFALQATALGIRSAFLNQPVEVATMRAQFAAFLGIGNRRPDLVLRFGRGPRMPSSLRRSVDAVMIEALPA